MENTTLQRKDLAVWHDMLSPPEKGPVTISAIMCFLACLILPMTDHQALSLLLLAGCVLFYYLLTRSLMAVLYYAVPGFLLFMLGSLFPAIPNPFLLPSAFAALLIGGGCGAFVLIHRHTPKRDWYLLGLPVAAFALVWLITGDPMRGLLSLLPLVMAVTAALCLWLYQRRTESTLTLAIVLAIALAVAALITLAWMGKLNGDLLTHTANELRESIVAMFRGMNTVYAEAGVHLGVSDVDAANVAALFVNVLPGLFICVCSITAFLIWRILLQLLVGFGTLPRLPLRVAAFTMSPLSAILFILAYFASLISNGSTVTLFGMVCENLSLILEPGLALIGFSVLFAKGAARSCLSRLLGFALIVTFWFQPAMALALAAFVGCFQILVAPRLPRPDGTDDPRH
ncbi:MAG: DUF2232 domain-containing protein [Clostridia bacterium]|nr:DUF2232 domain-containing protein [Clostridia bacterium]